VALSEKGEYALIGGPSDNEKAGAAWVFLRTGTTWAQQAEAHRQRRGRRRRIRRERGDLRRKKANYALVGAPGDNGASARRGSSCARARPGPAGAKLTGKRRDRQRPVRLQRGDRRQRRRIRADRRPQNKEGIGAAWVFLRTGKRPGPSRRCSPAAGRAARRIRQERGALRKRRIRADRRPQNGEGVGAAWVSPARIGKTTWTFQARAHREKRRESAKANSATAWRSPPKKATTRWSAAPANNSGVGAAWVFFRERAKRPGRSRRKLTGSPESGAGSVRLQRGDLGPGEYALMGGVADNKEVGAAWVFLRKRHDLGPAGRKADRQRRDPRRRIQRQRRLRLQRGDLLGRQLRA
jgi:hypothetical protein